MRLLACPVLLLAALAGPFAARAARAEPSALGRDSLPRLPVLIPFPDCGSTVLLPVRVNGRGPLLFILDSGANSIALDHTVADSLGLVPADTGTGSGAGGKFPYRRYARDSVEFEVAGVRFRSDHVISIDLSNQPGILGYRVAGVLGTDFFRKVTVDIDYDALSVRLHDPDRYSLPDGARAIPLTFERRLPFVDVRLTVPGVPARSRRLLVDSGSEDAVDDSLLLESRAALRRVTGGVGSGQTYQVVLGRVRRLELGPFVLEDLPSVAPGVALIGGEVLRRFRVTFDYARERLILTPGRHLRDEVPEDRSGLVLRLTADGERLRAEEVESGSPAWKAGIRAGEHVVAMDGTPVRALGLRRAQALLMAPGARVRLQVAGERGVREVELALPRTSR